MKRITTSIPDDLAKKVDIERRRRDVSSATVIREALAKYFVESTEKKEDYEYPLIGILGEELEPSNYSEYVEEILAGEYVDRIEGRNTLSGAGHGAPKEQES